MKGRNFDRKFDRGEDVTADLDMSKAQRPEQEQSRVNVDFPSWMVESPDGEARRLGVIRQSRAPSDLPFRSSYAGTSGIGSHLI